MLRTESPNATFGLYASLTVHLAERYAAAVPSAAAAEEEALVSMEEFNARVHTLLNDEHRVRTVLGLMLAQVTEISP